MLGCMLKSGPAISSSEGSDEVLTALGDDDVIREYIRVVEARSSLSHRR